jgi:ornithine cyclodeaminase
MANLRILSNDDVRAAINPDVALELARRTLRDQANGDIALSSPAAMALDATPLGGPRFKIKAATVGHLGASGVRLLSRPSAPGKDASNYCVVYDHDSSALSGLVPESWLSRIRTAAFGAAAIERLVVPGPLVVALFGTGAIAREMVPLLARSVPVAELRVHSRRAESMSALVSTYASTLNFPIRAEPDRELAVRDADLVITLTESPTPLVSQGSLKPGAVVCSMGSYNELEYGVLLDAQRLVVDDAEYAAEMGDGGAWIKQGHLSREEFAARVDVLACEVASGIKPGRLAPDERIVALIQGMAIGDVAFATYALRQAERLGRGTLVELP